VCIACVGVHVRLCISMCASLFVTGNGSVCVGVSMGVGVS